MFKFKKIFYFLLFPFFNTFIYADTKIVYIDLDLILSNTNVGKELFENLKKWKYKNKRITEQRKRT